MSGMSLSRFRRLGVAVAAAVAVLALTAPGVAQAQAATSPPPDAEVRQGTITWTLVTEDNPTPEQQQAYDLITPAMDAAVARYNNLSDLSKTITVYYDPGVPTADGNINGTIRFGSIDYMTERTALHETGHTLGVGTSGNWGALGCPSTFTGPAATALVKEYDGADAVISCDASHFWPYGLNYESEFSQTDADRHVEIVEAMVADGL
jgi:hypothetical protein